MGRVTSIFLAGAFGGAAPNLIKFSGMAMAGDLPGGTYFVGVAVLAAIGGGVALVHKERKALKAFFLGIGGPALIVATGNAADAQHSSAYVERGGAQASSAPASWSFIATAYAQPREPVLPEAERAAGPAETPVRVLTVRFADELPIERVVVAREDGETRPRRTSAHAVRPDADKELTLRVPADAAQVWLEGDGGKTEAIALPRGSAPLTLTVRGADTTWAGLMRAFGLDRRARVRVVESALLELKVEPPAPPATPASPPMP